MTQSASLCTNLFTGFPLSYLTGMSLNCYRLTVTNSRSEDVDDSITLTISCELATVIGYTIATLTSLHQRRTGLKSIEVDKNLRNQTICLHHRQHVVPRASSCFRDFQVFQVPIFQHSNTENINLLLSQRLWICLQFSMSTMFYCPTYSLSHAEMYM